MHLPSITLSDPFPTFKDSNNIWKIKFHDGKHTPYNKRPGEVKSIAELTVQRCEIGDPPWVEFIMEEITTSDNGRVAGRTITTVMTLDMAKRIAQFINEGK
jgi:hypothetical protein